MTLPSHHTLTYLHSCFFACSFAMDTGASSAPCGVCKHGTPSWLQGQQGRKASKQSALARLFVGPVVFPRKQLRTLSSVLV